MFEIQEDHVIKILIVASKVNVPMANVPKVVKTIMTAHMKIIVSTISACPGHVDCQRSSGTLTHTFQIRVRDVNRKVHS